jgi:hypothetical protein
MVGCWTTGDLCGRVALRDVWGIWDRQVTQQEPTGGTKPSACLSLRCPINQSAPPNTKSHEEQRMRGFTGTWKSDAPCIPEADLRCGGQGLRVYNTSHLPLHTCHAGCTQHCNVAASQRSLLTGLGRLPVRCNLSIKEPHLISIASCHLLLVKQLVLSHAPLDRKCLQSPTSH